MFLHTHHPQPLLFSIGPISIYWYGFIITCGLILGFLVSLRLARQYGIKKEQLIDLGFWLIIFGLIGARLYHVLSEWQYYFHNPLDIIKIWNGGLGIYGALIAGMVVVWVYSKKLQMGPGHQKFSIFNFQFSIHNTFWLLLDILAPALILAQALGRWGNYFNQEIFGLPTTLPWAIPISPLLRPEAYRGFEFFHPTFLYQSLINFIIFGVLIWMHWKRIKVMRGEEGLLRVVRGEEGRLGVSKVKQSFGGVEESLPRVERQEDRGTSKVKGGVRLILNTQYLIPGAIFLFYLILYSLSRFFLEFLRLDTQPIILGLRLGHWTSGVLFVAGIGLIVYRVKVGVTKRA